MLSKIEVKLKNQFHSMLNQFTNSPHTKNLFKQALQSWGDKTQNNSIQKKNFKLPCIMYYILYAYVYICIYLSTHIYTLKQKYQKYVYILSKLLTVIQTFKNNLLEERVHSSGRRINGQEYKMSLY